MLRVLDGISVISEPNRIAERNNAKRDEQISFTPGALDGAAS